MPDYLIRVTTDAILDKRGLDRLEDVVYDVLVDEKGASLEFVPDGGGVTDVEATFN